jgi:hypothetical protein
MCYYGNLMLCFFFVLVPLSLQMTSSMAWYRGGTTATSAGDEFFENQAAGGWSLWAFSASDERQDTAGARGEAALEEESPRFTQPTEEIFLYVPSKFQALLLSSSIHHGS